MRRVSGHSLPTGEEDTFTNGDLLYKNGNFVYKREIYTLVLELFWSWLFLSCFPLKRICSILGCCVLIPLSSTLEIAKLPKVL